MIYFVMLCAVTLIVRFCRQNSPSVLNLSSFRNKAKICIKENYRPNEDTVRQNATKVKSDALAFDLKFTCH